MRTVTCDLNCLMPQAKRVVHSREFSFLLQTFPSDVEQVEKKSSLLPMDR
jgi:hypothetical protein